MSFWQRLFFPRTTLASEQAEELRFYREQTAKLIDSIVESRGQKPVFQPTIPTEKAQALSPVVDTDDWRTEAELAENERAIRQAVGDEEAYAELLEAAEFGDQNAARLLNEADQRIRAMQAFAGGVQ